MLEIDGSLGEGGGQILRTALSLAMCTGTPFRINHIRAKRKKPGLLRQHLTAVLAATEICGAEVTGAVIGSPCLTFVPGKIRSGEYRFAIGTAGSCTLVLQTLLPALWSAEGPSKVVLQGGTHNPMAPPFHFLERAFVPLLERMGISISLTLDRFGFYPAGGGQITVEIESTPVLKPLMLMERGERLRGYAESFISGVPAHVAKRELHCIGEGLNWADENLLIRQVHQNEGPGNVLFATIEHTNIAEVFCSFGEKGVSAESVARNVLTEVREYLAGNAVVGQHLADQLLLPMALSGGGSFSTPKLTTHATSNMSVIQRFLPIEYEMIKQEKCCRLNLKS